MAKVKDCMIWSTRLLPNIVLHGTSLNLVLQSECLTSSAAMKWVIDYLYPRNFSTEAIPTLDDKVVLITGGCSGLGYEIATQCAVHNARRILILSFPSQRLNEAVQSISEKLTNPQGMMPILNACLTGRASGLDSYRSCRPSFGFSCCWRYPLFNAID